MTEPLRILMVAAEMGPWAKVGGLGDVLAALPGALHGDQAQVTVVVPLTRPILDQIGRPEPLPGGTYSDRIGPQQYEVTLRRATQPGGVPPNGVPVVLVDCPGLLDREVYLDPESREPYPDQIHRWGILCRGAIRAGQLSGGRWDVIHAHDAHAALALAYHRFGDPSAQLASAVRVLSIHNIGYPEIFPIWNVSQLGLPESEAGPMGPLEYWGELNLLKAGMSYADGIHVVSPTYAEEVKSDSDMGYGLSGLLRSRGGAVRGILNGIDDVTWDPSADPYLPAHYAAGEMAGKAANKRALVRELGWPEEAAADPLLGIVSRFVWQKGIDLVLDAAEELLADGVRLVMLGTGEPEIEERCSALERRYPGAVAVPLRYDEGLAHRIEAGADLFLMPSRYEPCGLNQMYSLRYGTVPVVRRTGGLADTIIDADEKPESGNGFVFDAPVARDMAVAVRRALAAMAEPGRWRRIQKRGMVADLSWKQAAWRYLEWYRELISGRTSGP